MPKKPGTEKNEINKQETKKKEITKQKEKLPEDVFWADYLAAQCIKRAEKEKNHVTCRAAASPSGGKHIGNMFDVMKSYIVHKSVLSKGFKSRFVFTHDDKDPMRTVPPRIPDLDGKWMKVNDEIEKKISKYLGVPYNNIPDPFGCCDSWAAHFARVWTDGVEALDIKMDSYFTSKLYAQGKLEPYLIKILERLKEARKIIRKHQQTKKADYIPFDAVCEKCGRIIGKAISFDLKTKTIKYVCEGKKLAGKYVIKGCGHSGEVPFLDGKLPWRFEWPAQWALWKTIFEPHGKELAEGSWKSGIEIVKKIYDYEPPITQVYELLLVDGEKMAARRGNAYITQEMLQIVEPEIFTYFYTKRSGKQRNLDLKHIHHLTDEFERTERIYFGKEKETNEKEKITLNRMYETSMPSIAAQIPFRIPYQLAVLVAQACPDERLESAIELLKKTGHIQGNLAEEDKNRLLKRLALAENWVDVFAPENKLVINEKPPHVSLGTAEKNAVNQFISILKKDLDEKALSTEMYEIIQHNKLETKDFFRLMYNIIISKEQGPRLAPFILAIGRDKVRKLLEQLK